MRVVGAHDYSVPRNLPLWSSGTKEVGGEKAHMAGAVPTMWAKFLCVILFFSGKLEEAAIEAKT